MKVLNVEDLSLKVPFEGVERRHLSTEGATFSYLLLRKGSIVPRHHHPHEQITYIPQGRVRVTTPKGMFEMGPGTVMVIPSNVPHEFEALEDTIDVDFFHPARSDFEG